MGCRARLRAGKLALPFPALLLLATINKLI